MEFCVVAPFGIASRHALRICAQQMLVDVTREEGEVTAEGDAFSAANMNDLEERIEEALTSGYVFYINADRQLVVRYAEGYEPPPLSIKDRQLVYTIS